jgi:hypothetical protein
VPCSRLFTVGFAFVIGAMPVGVLAQSLAKPAQDQPGRRYLNGVTRQQADELVAKVKEAQRKLKGGEKLYFDLLSGAPAAYDMNGVPPRAAFLKTDFDRTWNIEHKDSGNPLWQPYRLSVISTKLGEPYWDVEVVIGVNGQIERIEMFYRPPAPF